MNVILYRILGNDLWPRHAQDQTEKNLRSLLLKEPFFENCEKRFVLNRILDKKKEREYCDFLEVTGHQYSVIPFEEYEYSSLETFAEKVHYTTNVNPARNFCVKQGFEELAADVVLPFDGGSMFRQDGWDSFIAQAEYFDDFGYFILGQWRVNHRDQLLSEHTEEPELYEEYVFEDKKVLRPREYAVAFTKNYDYLFDERIVYPNGDKVELFFQLGVEGIWDQWYTLRKKQKLKKKSKWYKKVPSAGWLGRLPSGNSKADKDNKERGWARKKSIDNLVEQADLLCLT